MSPAAVADRLAALERAHRRLRALVAALTLALLAALLLGAGGDGVLTGRALKLLDAQGRLRLLLTASTGVSFLDAAGRTRASLGLDPDGAGPALNGADSRAILNVDGAGPALTLTGAGGKLRAVLALVDGQPGLVFLDGEERERARFSVAAGGGRGLLRDADGGTTWRVPDHD